MQAFDILVVGGGVNGAGIARDLSGRGYSVILAEQGDLAQATSSASSKLIHGGLRYLEHYEFRLVREALGEREVLLRMAPHIIWPLRFVLPHRPEMRPRWLIRAGLFLYDHLARRVSLPGAQSFLTAQSPMGAALKPDITHAFAYSDAWVEDSRLVLLNALDAKRRGADIRTRTRFEEATRHPGHWDVTLRGPDAQGQRIRVRGIVNAAGPWVQRALDSAHTDRPGAVRLIRGSHIVLPRLYEGEHAFILQNDDRRVVFVIPYEQDFSLIGTTDVPHEGDAASAHCTAEEAEYLCAAVSRQFRRQITPAEIIWSYSGVRPLFDDGADDPSAVTRDYVLKLDEAAAPLLSVYGGKITTFRRLAEEATGQIAKALGREGTPWTAGATLPGGDLGGRSIAAFTAEMARALPFLDPASLPRLVRTHGSELPLVFAGGDPGQALGAGFTEAELHWMRREEWVRSAEDALWRRTKLGLHMTATEREAVAARFDTV
ncbi:glycerol-3-phosphate dehydrogenase [Sediminicoccus sp. KRV36]|uniref:glycerol-3-phosphate dehydrogenase n=1 Tax=Sediminicoccus sp. KRV36 TaxID=3133721 RepID=UPI00200C0F79|nr:glycerol-3-phosphate dehydrogenase [Sediminicoccus rosea]UPY39193.1 glycerol-3-phosphate dehydrogenase [Sediminicoccus rosea]